MRQSLKDSHEYLLEKGGFEEDCNDYHSLNDLKKMVNSMNDIRSDKSKSICNEHESFKLDDASLKANGLSTHAITDKLDSIKPLCSQDAIYSCTCQQNVSCACNNRTIGCHEVTTILVTPICGSRTTYSIDIECKTRTTYIPDIRCHSRTTYIPDSLSGNITTCTCNTRSKMKAIDEIICKSRIGVEKDVVSKQITYGCTEDVQEVCTCENRTAYGTNFKNSCDCNIVTNYQYLGCQCEQRITIGCGCDQRSRAKADCLCNTRQDPISNCQCNSRVKGYDCCDCVNRTSYGPCVCNARSNALCQSRTTCTCDMVCTCEGVNIFK